MKKKKNLLPLLKKIVPISIAAIICLGTVTLFIDNVPFFSKDKIEDKPVIQHQAHYTIPEISSEKGPIIQYLFQKNDINCITRYNITANLPIFIERYYPKEGRKEYFILRPLDVSQQHIQALYQLVQKSKEHIGKYEPHVVSRYSTPWKVRSDLIHNKYRMHRDSSYVLLGVFYRKEGETTERLIGSVSINPFGEKEKAREKGIPEGVYGAYWVGDESYINVRGVAYISFRALVDHMIYTGRIKNRINLVIRKDNKGSIRIAKKLNMPTCKSAEKIYPAEEWDYPIKIDNAYIYRITVAQWKARNWKK